MGGVAVPTEGQGGAMAPTVLSGARKFLTGPNGSEGTRNVPDRPQWLEEDTHRQRVCSSKTFIGIFAEAKLPVKWTGQESSPLAMRSLCVKHP